METAKQILQSLKYTNQQVNKTMNEQKKLIRNYEHCMSYCKSSDYILCLFDTTSSKYAIATIKIYIPECSQIMDFTDVITFTDYMENNEIKQLPYNRCGIIPNYKYEIGDARTFENNHQSCLHQGNPGNRYEGYYLIDIRIPFVTDDESI